MMIALKYCGLKDARHILLARDLGIDYVGFITYPKSSRYISIEKIIDCLKDLQAHLPSGTRNDEKKPMPKMVAVTVNLGIAKTQALIQAFVDCHFPLFAIQIHGDETASDIKFLSKEISKYCHQISCPVPEIWRAIRIRHAQTLSSHAKTLSSHAQTLMQKNFLLKVSDQKASQLAMSNRPARIAMSKNWMTK